MPRHHHRRRIIVIPPSTAGTLVFPWKDSIKKFDTSSYNPIMTNNRVSLEEINQILDEALVPVMEWRDKQLFIKYPWAIIILVILLPLLYIYMFYLACTSCSKQKEFEEVKEKSRAILKEKGAHFEQRGLAWVVPAHFPRWIELWTGQGGMQPNMMMQQQMMMQPNVGQNGYAVVPINNQQMGMNNNMMMTNQQAGFTQPNQQMQYGAGMYSGNNMNV